MKLTFYGATETVTGSCYLLRTGEYKVLVDCGMFQGTKLLKERNYGPFPFEPQEVDLVLLTHAHIDHSGLLPKLFKQGYRGKVISTHGTRELCEVMLPDSGHIQEMEVERKNRKNLRSGKPLLQPIYTANEASACLKYFEGVTYDVWQEPLEGMEICFHEAGHILGSAIIEIRLKTARGQETVVFSGDVGNEGQPIVNDPFVLEAADYLIMESTYGDRIREKQDDGQKLAQLAAAINETFQRGGNLIIPAFAVERTQDLLYYLNLLINRGDISAKQIVIDSPLAIAATEIFCNHPEYFDPETKNLQEQNGGACPLYIQNLTFSRTAEESKALNRIKQGALIISASGMCDAGRIKHHLRHNLWREECTVLLVGYQAEGTLGRRLLDGAKKVQVHGEEVMVRAEIRNMDWFSAHADQGGLLEWVRKISHRPRQIFLTHGEEKEALTLARLMEEENGVPTHVPQWLEEVDLGSGVTRRAVLEIPSVLQPGIELEQQYEQFKGLLGQWFEQTLDRGDNAAGIAKLKELAEKLSR